MKLRIALYPSEEGYAVSVPSLPGCWSQGETREEAIANIIDAIQEYLETEMLDPEAEEGAEFEELCLCWT